MTNQPDDLVETLTADKLPECSFDEGKTWEIDSVAVAEVFSRAADYIKELKAEVERLTVQLEIESLPSMYCEACGSCGEPGCGCPKKCLYPGARAHLAEERAEEAEARATKAKEALRRIAEGNLGDMSWQANYDRIRQVTREALGEGKA